MVLHSHLDLKLQNLTLTTLKTTSGLSYYIVIDILLV